MNLFISIGAMITLATAAGLAWVLMRHPERPAPQAGVVSALLLVGVTLLLYQAGSNFDWAAPATEPQTIDPEFAAAIESLEQRLAAEGEDADGWLLLGNSYLQTGAVDRARVAFGKALAVSSPETRPLAQLGLAEAEVLLDRDALGGSAGDLIEQALLALPENPKALWYGGLTALVRGDSAAVTVRWERLLAQNPPDAIRRVVTEQLATLSADPAELTASTTIQVDVNVSAALRSQIAAGAILFLVARDAGQPGPPLAVIRQPATVLPATLTIGDDNAMLAGRKLADATSLRLIARVANAGDPIAQPGDLFGEANWAAGDGPVSIAIDQIVQP